MEEWVRWYSIDLRRFTKWHLVRCDLLGLADTECGKWIGPRAERTETKPDEEACRICRGHQATQSRSTRDDTEPTSSARHDSGDPS